MLKVEEKLLKSISKTLPTVKEIAAEVNLSVSTLQRHFRIISGKNIYEYYQEKRMVWGKSQIEGGHKNINEVAYELGFFKVNNFSRAFKKQFNILPRELKHKNFNHHKHPLGEAH